MKLLINNIDKNIIIIKINIFYLYNHLLVKNYFFFIIKNN
jgi:hypothetical protein